MIMSSSDRPDLVFLSDLYTFSFLTITVLSRISSSMLKRSGKREYPSFVPYVSGKAMFLAGKCGVVCGFSVDSVYQVEKPPLIICLLIRLSLLNCKNSLYILHINHISDIVVVQLLSCLQLFETPWTAAHQAALSFAISWSLHKFMSIEFVMPSNHLFLC